MKDETDSQVFLAPMSRLRVFPDGRSATTVRSPKDYFQFLRN